MKGMQLGDFILHISIKLVTDFVPQLFRWRTVKDGMILVYPNTYQPWRKM